MTFLFQTGCSGLFDKQRWSGGTFGQGDIARQSARAVFFDPYPFNDIGPEVVGGRPREFAVPMPEAQRNKLERPYMGNGGARVPGFPATPFPPGYPVPGQFPQPAPIYQQPFPAAPYNGGYILPQMTLQQPM